jgi:thiamine-phosphate pyrophosphorylase
MTRGASPTAWNPRSAVLCFVTPGAALPFAAPTLDERAAALVALIADAVTAGVDLVQVREPDLPARVLCGVVEASVKASRTTTTRIVVNDRLDVALACGADGVHLGARSLPAARAREIAPPGFLIGRSIHTAEEAEAASADPTADYLIAGTVFWSASKPAETRLLGTDGLAAVVRVAAVPVLAIGGVDLDTIAPVAATGARGFAAIRFFCEAAAGSRLHETVRRARATFDTTPVIP